MPTIKLVSYLRVSTRAQGESGLGLEAQREAVRKYAEGHGAEVVAEFVEVESGRKNDRPQLGLALDRCKLIGGMLALAKLDRLSRDAHFLLGLQKSGVEFVAADMPHANRLTVGIMALVAEEEARAISSRTKAALAAAKARGVKLGGSRGYTGPAYDNSADLKKAADEFAARVAPTVRKLRDDGVSLRGIAAELDAQGIKTRHGKKWSAEGVSAVLERADAQARAADARR